MSRTIIIYYSHTGNTKKLAEQIQKKIGADIAEIRTVQEYTGTYDEILEQGKKEVESGYCPEIYPLEIDLKQYDRVILGTPVWWYSYAPALGTFFRDYDLSEKDIILLTTSGGWMGHIIEDIERTVPGIEIKNYISLQFNENEMATPMSDFERWMEALAE